MIYYASFTGKRTPVAQSQAYHVWLEATDQAAALFRIGAEVYQVCGGVNSVKLDERPGVVWRWVPTYRGVGGLRTLMRPAQGRWTFGSQAEAERWLAAILRNSTEQQRDHIWGRAPRFQVARWPCWAGHFDPVGIYAEVL